MFTDRKRTVLLTVLCLVLSLALIAAEKEPPGANQGTSFTAKLSGAAELPGPGDPDGSGSARIVLNPSEGVVCWQISVKNIALPATAAHIHVGTITKFGAVVVALSPPDASGVSSGCTSANVDLINAILQNPSGYYVNVHTKDFPAGAVRGQLTG